MADFSLVLDKDQVVSGIWLKNPNEANDIFFMTMLSARIANEGAKFPKEYQAAVLAKQYRIVPNTQNASGGVFVMFGDALAPGEQKVAGIYDSDKNAIEQNNTHFLYPLARHSPTTPLHLLIEKSCCRSIAFGARGISRS